MRIVLARLSVFPEVDRINFVQHIVWMKIINKKMVILVIEWW